ncbi:MAG TPA: hypothetical protein VGN16_18320 [Acidobacteriaceae bacterium]|jgi:hypothetical protein
MLKRFTLDRATWLCSLLCTVTFLFWMHDAAGGTHAGAIVFFLGMPLVFYCLGQAMLRWLHFPAGPGHPFPLAFLLGSATSALLLFILHLCLPLPLRVVDLGLAVAAILAYALAPVREPLEAKDSSPWKAVAAVALALAAASLWTQDLRPGLIHQGNEVVVDLFNDAIIHAEFVAELHDDASILKLGDPALSGRALPVYHYASYILPASVEVWSPSTTAFETVLTFWTPFGFFVMGLAAFGLATEWLGELGGLAALCAVLMVPSTPLYGVPIAWYSFHRLIAISIGLAYGIAGASAALILLSAGLRLNRKILLTAGFVLMGASVFLKAHIALAAFPLGVAWVLCVMPGWTWKKRLTIAAVLTVAGYAILAVMDRLKIGPNILPNGQHGSLQFVSGFVDEIGPGFWHHLIFHRFFYNRFIHPFGVTFILFAGILGIWLVLGLGILFADWKKRSWKAYDLLPVLATAIFLFYTYVPPPNQRGTVDELWLRPFIWFYFLVAVWCAAKVAGWLQQRWDRQSPWPTAVVLVVSVGLLAVPFVNGKTVQHSEPHLPGLTNMQVDAGFMDSALYVRTHGAQSDIVQSQVSNVYPLLASFAERRAYLGQSTQFWEVFFHGTPAMAECEIRHDTLESMRKARTNEDLTAFEKKTGIRWYIVGPHENLSWPDDVLQNPVFVSEGFRVYDLEKIP